MNDKKQETGPPQDREIARVEAEAVARQPGVTKRPAADDPEDHDVEADG